MKENKIKKLLEENGAKLDHIGILSEDYEATMDTLNRLPMLGEFRPLGTTRYGEEVLSVGKPYTITIGIAAFQNLDLKLEILKPERELTQEGCIYTDHLDKHGQGLHHLAYELPDIAAYNKVVDAMLSMGDKVILKGRIEPGMAEGLPNGIEFVYLEPANGSACYLELKTENLR